MANDYLKTALAQAGVTVEQFADIISVDPKTVQRWVGGRTPYARHRGTISRALDIPEHQLWPDTVPAPARADDPDPGRSAPGAVTGIQGWAYSNDDGAPNPIALLTELYDDVDLLDPTGKLLFQPGVVAALQNLIDRRATVRVITTGLAAGHRWPTACRQIGLRWIEDLQSGHIILRLDGLMLLVLPLHDDQTAPLLALQRPGAGEIFDRFASHINRLWDTATPISTSATSAAPAGQDSTPDQVSSEPPRHWPRSN